MFNFFKKDPVKKLQKQYEQKSEQAMQAQRNGKMALFANLSAEAQEILDRMKEIEATSDKA